MAKKKYLKLDTPANIRKSLNRISNMLLNKEIDPNTAKALTYSCNIILSALRVDEYEKEVERLKDILTEAGLKGI